MKTHLGSSFFLQAWHKAQLSLKKYVAPSLQTFNMQVYVLLHVERSTHLSPLAQGAALDLGRNVKSFHCQTLIPSIHLCARFQIRIYPPISSAESVLCAFCLNLVNFSTQPPKYATADNLCFTFCISITHLLQKPTSELLFWSTGGNQTEEKTHGGWIQQQNWLLKFCAKFKANCSRWLADAR